MDKATKIRKLIENQPVDVGVESGAEACGKTPTQKVVIRTGKKFYSPPLPYTYKETELSEDLHDGMEWVFRGYGRYLKKSKDLLLPRYNVMKFYVRTNTKELDNNLKL